MIAGWRPVAQALERMGATVLVNESRPARRGGSRIWLVGLGDPAAAVWGRPDDRAAAPDPERALSRAPEGEVVIALAHTLALWPALARRGVGLTLSGHTHHGQLAIPGLRWSLVTPFLEHAMGSYSEGTSLIYISPGTNFWESPSASARSRR